MNKTVIELSGQRFMHLTVLKYCARKSKNGSAHWICKCDCGRTLIVRSDNLRLGRTTKCGECRNGAGVLSVYCKEEGEQT